VTSTSALIVPARLRSKVRRATTLRFVATVSGTASAPGIAPGSVQIRRTIKLRKR